jgi:hypothetical protein
MYYLAFDNHFPIRQPDCTNPSTQFARFIGLSKTSIHRVFAAAHAVSKSERNG